MAQLRKLENVQEIQKDRQTNQKRIQFEFSSEAVERLNKIKRESNAISYVEVVRNALRVYEWVLENERSGFEIGVVKDDDLVKIIKFLY